MKNKTWSDTYCSSLQRQLLNKNKIFGAKYDGQNDGFVLVGNKIDIDDEVWWWKHKLCSLYRCCETIVWLTDADLQMLITNFLNLITTRPLNSDAILFNRFRCVSIVKYALFLSVNAVSLIKVNEFLFFAIDTVDNYLICLNCLCGNETQFNNIIGFGATTKKNKLFNARYLNCFNW